MPAPQSIVDLAHLFEQNREQYRNGHEDTVKMVEGTPFLAMLAAN